MSKRVEEFVKRENEMDELARIKVEAIKGLLTELDDVTDKRAEQCKDFLQTLLLFYSFFFSPFYF